MIRNDQFVRFVMEANVCLRIMSKLFHEMLLVNSENL